MKRYRFPSKRKTTTTTMEYDETTGLLRVPPGTSDLVKSLLPQTKSDFDRFMDALPNVRDHDEIVRRIALGSLNQRTPEWVKENGMCMVRVK